MISVGTEIRKLKPGYPSPDRDRLGWSRLLGFSITDTIEEQMLRPVQLSYRPVTEGALIKRINRQLNKDTQRLCKTRGWRSFSNLGTYYILDYYYNLVTAHHIHLEFLGAELGVLDDDETIVFGL